MAGGSAGRMEQARRVQAMGLVLLGLLVLASPVASIDYGDALSKSLLYFEAQMSGKLPAGHRVSWRGDSGLQDGQEQGIDLTGGFYDAGDNVKFGLPMAFTITMLSWNVIEYRTQLQKAGQLNYALQAIKWGTDYFIKAHPEPNVLWGEVGDGESDHDCWMQPERMTTSRKAYKIDANNPGSDLAGETAAALAAASIVFASTDSKYSDTLLSHAKQLFTFADTYRGTYDASIPVVAEFYKSWSGFNDELLWASAWLYQATDDASFLQYLVKNADALGGTGWAMDQFSWDNKYAGVQIKATKFLLEGNGGQDGATLEKYRVKAEYFLCGAVQANSGGNLKKSPGGMFWIQPWNNMQYVTTAAFLLTVASDYYTKAHQSLKYCSSPVSNSQLLAAGKEQVDYILGKNPRGTSYMVGFGSSFPQRVHHRAASISSPVSCKDGFSQYYFVSSSNPHVINGAITGGPDANDNYNDQRDDFAMAEPALYNTAPLVGTLARLSFGSSLGSVGPDSVTPLDTVISASYNPGTQSVSATSTHQSRQTRSSRTRPAFSGDCIAISQKLVQKWTSGRNVYYKSTGKVTNNCKATIAGTTFVVHGLFGTLNGFSKESRNGNIYSLPEANPMIQPGASVAFSYIQRRGQRANIYVRNACPTCSAAEM